MPAVPRATEPVILESGKTVYISKLGANGGPQLWNPTSTNQATWVYWYKDTNMSSPRYFTKAVAYNNNMYLLGGQTSTSGTVSVTNTVQIANITATGTLGTWASSSLPISVFGHSALTYNNRLYLIGGASTVGGAPLSSVYYAVISSNGTLNSWVQTSSMPIGLETNGGDFATIWGGFIYVSSGCSAVNSSNYCSTVSPSTYLASINADGSLDAWGQVGNVSDSRMGHNIFSWRDYVLEVGGCSVQDSSSGICTSALNTINYGAINQDGDVSTVAQSQASGTSPCSGGSPTECNLPGTTYIGDMLNACVYSSQTVIYTLLAAVPIILVRLHSAMWPMWRYHLTGDEVSR